MRRFGAIGAAIFAAVVAIGSTTLFVSRSVTPSSRGALPPAPATVSPAPIPTSSAFEGGVIGAIVTTKTAAVRSRPDLRSPASSVIRSGILLPVLARTNGFFQVMTPCEKTGWVSKTSTIGFAQSVRPASSLKEATVVVDPGHGGPESGATGPHGLKESTVDLDIAKRITSLLPGARVFLTRSDDYMAGLAFRSALANSLHADAFISVHNNAQPDGPSSKPGTETYYQFDSTGSKRLAGLTYEELLPALRRLKTSWVSDKDAGAKYRTNAKGLDYYAVLRRSKIPAVITESLFITNAPEEALLRKPATRETIAAALARAVDRFVTTPDPGSGFVKPLVKNEGSVFILPPTCRDPT